jgi:hypothetical protein
MMQPKHARQHTRNILVHNPALSFVLEMIYNMIKTISTKQNQQITSKIKHCRIMFNSSFSLAHYMRQICEISLYLKEFDLIIVKEHLYRTKKKCTSEKKRLKTITYIHIYSKSQLILKTAP